MPTPRSANCSRCGLPKSNAGDFFRKGSYADGTSKLSANCKACTRLIESTPERQEQKRASKERARRAQGIPVRQRGASEFCPQGHLKADNLRPGRYDCAACHRNAEATKRRAADVPVKTRAGESWSCGHDSAVATRYSKGMPKGCGQCHRENSRNAPYKPEVRRRYVELNRDKINAYRRSWRAANRPDIVEFQKGGPEAIKYARMIGNDPCVYCGGRSTAIDHVKPVTRGGVGNWENLAPVCTSCNSSKSNKDVLQFLMYRLDRIGDTP
ncbi:HNH endonuclease signature motif containing protein [Streptomyces sp. NPDC047981]|uniref:HNH endonuclease n=1 Tax=Streptomyces sp. NPDC047981 TaxID=3154610 RepID=UPI00343F0AD1